ncbi:hypothetical protein L596_011267 [Steinernema carpocapsae]|uniref:Osteopetrosis-associated transmembrane protein 1 n=1 Tax=Steinernema carpocapsae TaxID=34508 RepID=A0A4U5NTV9_STECR|nr:hypothetical protein L596_011267 [Steinernema carpocapsae]
MMKRALLGAVFVFFLAGEALVEAYGEAWDLDAPCQTFVKRLAKSQAKMIQCASNFSSPPKVCTNCIEEYMQFKQTEYETKLEKNETSLDGTPCSQVIYSSYLLSYNADVSNTITHKIWEQSRCDSCLHIHWDHESGNNTFDYEDSTMTFQLNLFQWRNCVSNVTSYSSNTSEICTNCMDHFNELFKFYWEIYTAPEIDFCLDVETTMNDTITIWHNVWQCSDDLKPFDRRHDATMLIFVSVFLFVITFFFYAGSYIQAERAQRNLLQYSRMMPPTGLRSRLMSSSTLTEDFSLSSTSHAGQLRPAGLPASSSCYFPIFAFVIITRVGKKSREIRDGWQPKKIYA